MSIGKSNGEIKEQIVFFFNEKFGGIEVMKWRKLKKKTVEALSGMLNTIMCVHQILITY